MTTTRRQAILFLSGTVFLWGIPALFIHYFARHLDAHSQNLWRYASALAFLVLFARWSGEPRSGADWRGWTRTALAATTLVTYQTFFTRSLYHAQPAFITLLIQLELIVAIALSCAFFADERRVVRSPWFLVGAGAAMAGAVGMVLFSRAYAAGEAQPAAWQDLWVGVVLVGGAAVFWGTYSVTIKWCLQVLPPFSAFIRVEAIATLQFLVLALRFGTPGTVVQLRAEVVLLVFFSGVACIALAHILYTRALTRLGVAVCNTAFLATCVVAAVASRLVFGERLTVLQILSAAVLLGGAAAAIHTGGHAHRRNGAWPDPS